MASKRTPQGESRTWCRRRRRGFCTRRCVPRRGRRVLASPALNSARRRARTHTRAQLNLGLLYESGTHVPQSVASAESWYTRAAAQGDGRLGQERLASLRQCAAAATAAAVCASCV